MATARDALNLHPGDLFEGALAKFNRGSEHATQMQRAINQWLSLDPYQVVRVPAGGLVSSYEIRIRIEKPIDATRIGLLFGDAVHCFRCSFDHLVGVLAYFSTKTEPNWREIAFPICSTESNWWSAVSSGRLRGLAPDLIDQIRSRQPFVTAEGRSPDEETLAILRDLDDMDKHRHLVPMLCFPHTTTASVSVTKPGVAMRQTFSQWVKPTGESTVLKFDSSEPVMDLDNSPPNEMVKVRPGLLFADQFVTLAEIVLRITNEFFGFLESIDPLVGVNFETFLKPSDLDA